MRTIALGIISILFMVSCSDRTEEKEVVFNKDQKCIQIVLFHFNHRCESCLAVENETKTFLEQKYRKELESGDIRFLSLDIFSESGKSAANQLHAYGLNLFIVKADSILDLSSSAFLFAQTQPEKFALILESELKKFTQ